MVVVKTLKQNVCDDFDKLLKKLNKGYQPTDYQCILNKILFIETVNNLDHPNKIYECLITH